MASVGKSGITEKVTELQDKTKQEKAVNFAQAQPIDGEQTIIKTESTVSLSEPEKEELLIDKAKKAVDEGVRAKTTPVLPDKVKDFQHLSTGLEKVQILASAPPSAEIAPGAIKAEITNSLEKIFSEGSDMRKFVLDPKIAPRFEAFCKADFNGNVPDFIKTLYNSLTSLVNSEKTEREAVAQLKKDIIDPFCRIDSPKSINVDLSRDMLIAAFTKEPPDLKAVLKAINVLMKGDMDKNIPDVKKRFNHIGVNEAIENVQTIKNKVDILEKIIDDPKSSAAKVAVAKVIKAELMPALQIEKREKTKNEIIIALSRVSPGRDQIVALNKIINDSHSSPEKVAIAKEMKKEMIDKFVTNDFSLTDSNKMEQFIKDFNKGTSNFFGTTFNPEMKKVNASLDELLKVCKRFPGNDEDSNKTKLDALAKLELSAKNFVKICPDSSKKDIVEALIGKISSEKNSFIAIKTEVPKVEPPPVVKEPVHLPEVPQEAPLPEGWTKYTTKDNKIAYHNTITKENTWIRPTDDVLPKGFIEYTTEDGKKAYQNKVTGETSWKKPTVDAELPPNWEFYKTPDGKVAFHNTLTNENVWKIPKPVTQDEPVSKAKEPEHVSLPPQLHSEQPVTVVQPSPPPQPQPQPQQQVLKTLEDLNAAKGTGTNLEKPIIKKINADFLKPAASFDVKANPLLDIESNQSFIIIGDSKIDGWLYCMDDTGKKGLVHKSNIANMIDETNPIKLRALNTRIKFITPSDVSKHLESKEKAASQQVASDPLNVDKVFGKEITKNNFSIIFSKATDPSDEKKNELLQVLKTKGYITAEGYVTDKFNTTNIDQPLDLTGKFMTKEVQDAVKEALTSSRSTVREMSDLIKVNASSGTLTKKQMEEIKSKIREIAKELHIMRHKYGATTAELNPDLTKAELANGKMVAEIFTSSNLNIDTKLEIYKAMAEEQGSLHNCAVGFFEQVNSPEIERAYTKSLKDMACHNLDKSAPATFGADSELTLQKKYINDNTVLARTLVKGDMPKEKDAQFHPGYFGLFILQPNSGKELEAILNEDGTSAFEKRPSGEKGLHFYNTEGNNRRAFQRIVKEDGSITTFSTKGGGLDLTVDSSKLFSQFKNVIDGQKTKAMENKDVLRDPTEKLNVFTIDTHDDSHATIGFASYSIAGQDFENIRNKNKALNLLVRKQPEVYGALQKAFVRPAFTMAIARTQTNLDKLPVDVKSWCEAKNQMPTQLVTVSESETSLRLQRLKGKEDMYRLKGTISSDKNIYVTKFNCTVGSNVAKGADLYTYHEFADDAAGKAKFNAVTLIQDTYNNIMEGRSSDITSLVNNLKEKVLNNDSILKAKVDTLVTNAPLGNNKEKLTALRNLLNAVLESSGPAKVEKAKNDLKIEGICENKVINQDEEIFKIADLGVEHEEFMRVTNEQLKRDTGLRIPAAITDGLSGKDLELNKAAFVMSYNLMGSLALFTQDGDTTGFIGDSFDARNISNGSVRDEDEWGKGQFRPSSDGNRIVCFSNRDMQELTESLDSIMSTVAVDKRSKLYKDVQTTKGLVQTFFGEFFMDYSSTEPHKFGEKLIADNVKKKLEALGRNELESPQKEFWTAVKNSNVSFANLAIMEDKMKNSGKNYSEMCGQFDSVKFGTDTALTSDKVTEILDKLSEANVIKSISPGNYRLTSDAAVNSQEKQRVIKEELKNIKPALTELQITAICNTLTGYQDTTFVDSFVKAKAEFKAGLIGIAKEYLGKNIPESLGPIGALFKNIG